MYKKNIYINGGEEWTKKKRLHFMKWKNNENIYVADNIKKL